MDSKHLKNLLEQVKNGQVDTDAALHQLKKLPYENIGFARIDHHRCMRNGVPEVIYCEGKTIPQIQGIVEKLSQYNENILATRANPDVYAGIQNVIADCVYHEMARIVVVKPRSVNQVGH